MFNVSKDHIGYVTCLHHRFMVIPDMLKNAPMFKRLDARIKVWGHFFFSIFGKVLNFSFS